MNKIKIYLRCAIYTLMALVIMVYGNIIDKINLKKMNNLDKQTIKAIIILWLLFSAYVINAQPIYVGGKLVEVPMIQVTLMDAGIYGKYCQVDYGQNIRYAGQNTKKNLLTDEHGKKIKLKTAIQVINYFTERGWKLLDKDSDSMSSSDPALGGSYNSRMTTFLFKKVDQ